ncbi:MAG: Do family serine endopeptidase [Burkholderiaceae bacterium]
MKRSSLSFAPGAYAAGIVGGAGVTALQHTHAANAVAAAAPATAAATPMALPDFSRITAQNGPAVVNISVTGTTRTSDQPRGLPAAGATGPIRSATTRSSSSSAASSSGPQGGMPREMCRLVARVRAFIVSDDGIILTNAHVVRDADQVTVKLTDRREYSAKVLGSDAKTDVAVLKIEAKDLPTVTTGRIQDLQVGEWVLAIGAPFGFENTVTAGVVSAKGRSLPDDSAVPFIQTDVAVNPGNSGGPLFNTRGEVVGINAQIYSRTGGYQGLSFAIPIDLALKVKDQIVATGKVEHARLGVTIQEVNQALADSFKLERPEGALVASVESGSPADKAGLQTGDIIRSVDGTVIRSSGDLPAIISLATPGDTVALDIWRKGRSQRIEARLGSAGDTAPTVARNDAQASQGRLGLALRPLQPQEAQAVGAPNGLVVESVAGAAARAGINPGDVVLAVNGTAVKDVEQVRSIVEKSDKSVALLIQRDGDKIFVPIRLG